MKSIVRTTLSACVMASFLALFSHAQDLEAMMDEFYSGLADIIERNMEAPDQCASEVDGYYAANRELIAEINRLSQEAVDKAAPQVMEMSDEYESMSDEDLEALAAKAEAQSQGAEAKMPASAQRYAEAVRMFTMRYPAQGLRIATKALALTPRIR